MKSISQNALCGKYISQKALQGKDTKAECLRNASWGHSRSVKDSGNCNGQPSSVNPVFPNDI